MTIDKRKKNSGPPIGSADRREHCGDCTAYRDGQRQIDAEQVRRIEDLEHWAYGNGKDGAKTTVSKHADRLESLEDGRKEFRKMVWAVYVTLVSVLLATIGRLLMTL